MRISDWSSDVCSSDLLRKTDDAEFGGGIIGLAEIADEPARRGHMDIGARALRLEEGGGGAARIEAALQMHREYRVEILRTHFVEEHVAQVSGIVHHCVDAAETIDQIGRAHV